MHFRHLVAGATLLGGLASGIGVAGPVPGEAGLSGPGYSVRVWQMEQGLPQNGVTSIVQSREGYLWVGTYGGLARFDGVRFTVFDGDATPELRSNRVTSLFEDADGTLWIGHESGEVTRRIRDRFEPVRLPAAPRSEAVIGLGADAAGRVWLLGRSGLLRRADDGRSLDPGVPDHESPGLVAMTSDGAGALWIARGGGVSAVRADRLETVRIDPDVGGAGEPFVEGIGFGRDGGCWVVAGDRVRKWRGGQWVEDRGVCPWGRSSVTTVVELRDGCLAVGTLEQGLHLLPARGAPIRFGRDNGLPHDWIRCLREDREGNLWLGAGSGGLVVLRPARVTTVTAPDHWQGRAVLSVAAGRDGALWVSTEGAGLYRQERGQWTRFAEGDGLANPFVWSVAEDAAGRVWAGTWGGGLLRRNGERFERPAWLGDTAAPVLALWPARDGRRLWVGTGVGLWGCEAGRVTRYGRAEGLASPDVRAVIEDQEGTVWFGMFGGGLGRLREGVMRQFRPADGLTSDFVQCLHSDPDGALWIGTADRGLCRLKAGRFSAIGRNQQLANPVICHIADDGRGHLWMSTHGGLIRVARDELNRCADGELGGVHCLVYGQDDGLPTIECSGGLQPAGCRTADGRLWFTSTRGLVAVDPANVPTNSLAPPVVIEALHVGDAVIPTAIAPAGGIRIAPGRHRYEFRFTALSFAAPEKVRFKCRLEGLENEWIETGPKRFATYSFLPPGNYTFHVTACNNDGVWNRTEAVCAFRVLPFFWQTWWFLGLAVVTGVAGGGAGILWLARRRMRRQLELAERRHAIVRERARIAQDIHDDLGASLTRITLLSQSARADLGDPVRVATDLDRIDGTARELTRAMDEIVWAVNPQHDTLDSLASYLGKFAQDFLRAAGLRCRLDMPIRLPAWPLTAETRHNLFLAFKEALHNVLKHAAASEVRVALALEPSGFALSIEDNGAGFEPDRVPPGSGSSPDRLVAGHGLGNMGRRLAEIGGRCEIRSRPGQGTTVRFVVHPGKGVR